MYACYIDWRWVSFTTWSYFEFQNSLHSDFSYNEITSLGDEPLFSNQAKLIDLFLGHNAIREVPETAFHGLKTLQVLELENNGINYIHPEAFESCKELRDLYVTFYYHFFLPILFHSFFSRLHYENRLYLIALLLGSFWLV